MDSKKIKYILKNIQKSKRNAIKIYKSLTLDKCIKNSQININRICNIDEMLSQIEIILEMELSIDEDSKIKGGKNNE